MTQPQLTRCFRSNHVLQSTDGDRTTGYRGSSNRGKSLTIRRLGYAFVLLAGTATLGTAEEPATGLDKPAAPSKLQSKKLKWERDLASGRQLALTDRKPMLIRVGGTSCPWCEKLDREIATAKLQKILRAWTLVYIDVDKQPKEAQQLAVDGIPALRLQTITGIPIAEHNGYLAPDDLIAWLEEHLAAATAAPDAVLLASTKPSAMDTVKLIRLLDHSGPAVREVAMRRLVPHRETAVTVVRTLDEGRLATQLSALEILERWQAPVEQLDPWRPDTMTDQRLTALREWAATTAAAIRGESNEDKSPVKLNEQQTAEADDELRRMLTVDDSQAAAMRDRLARWGVALQPLVLSHLSAATSDQDLRRLRALRYALVAKPSLPVRWPGGLARLAASDGRVRQSAVVELVGLATDQEQALLLELFSDPDPLVREISLRGLRKTGGAGSHKALVRMLDDPDLNVRAAVLNELAEEPTASIATDIAKYVENETDSDLLVHAIRVLQEAKGRRALTSLLTLLKNESWQVRAAAAEGVSKVISDSGIPASVKANAYVQLIGLLEDDDAFVVSRGVQGLSGVEVVEAVEPLVKAARRFPELAPDIVDALVSGDLAAKALPHLREFTKHDEPRVRAAAINGLGQLANNETAADLRRALQDPDGEVRRAAATAIFSAVRRLRPGEQELINRLGGKRSSRTTRGSFGDSVIVVEPKPRSLAGRLLDLFKSDNDNPAVPPIIEGEAVEISEATPADEEGTDEDVPGTDNTEASPSDAPDNGRPTPPEKNKEGATDGQADDQEPKTAPNLWDQWITQFHAGKGRPQWLDNMVPPLTDMLTASDQKERLAAAVVLLATHGSQDAFTALVAEVKRDPSSAGQSVAQALPWLPWPQRQELFLAFRKSMGDDDQLLPVVYALNQTPDRRAAEVLWEIVDGNTLTPTIAEVLVGGLQTAYSGRRYMDLSNMSRKVRTAGTDAARQRTTSGSELRRLVGLAMMQRFDKEAAATAARAIADDESLAAALRLDAFRVTLGSMSAADRRKLVQESIVGTDVQRKHIALGVLVFEGRELSTVRGIEFPNSASNRMTYYSSGAKIIVPKAPRGITAEQILPLLADGDQETAAKAAYILALLGDGRGLNQLVTYWRDNMFTDSAWSRLVYRAVSAMNDSSHIDALEQIYSQLDRHNSGDFYWTIRRMTGREVLALRKRIRQEVGMDNLR